MANLVPEFISVLRDIRDIKYPDIVTRHDNVVTRHTNIISYDTLYQSYVASSLANATSALNSKNSADADVVLTHADVVLTHADVIKTAQDAVTCTNKAIIAQKVLDMTASASTLTAGSPASANYNPTTGIMSFGIPTGPKGDKGDAFVVNAIGTLAGRDAYDLQPINFTYYATDVGLIYFKLSATSGDWSVGSPFGKGDTGDTGNGIASITLTGTVGPVDTYRILYTDATFFDFDVTNGSVTSVAGKTGDVTLVSNDVGLNNVDNTSDVNKPISIATQIGINTKASINLSRVLQASLTLSNTIKSSIFDGFLYTGNGTSQSIVTGINSVDFTVASNGSGYWLDRTTFEVKTDAGAVVASGSCNWLTYDATSGETPRGLSKVHIKDRTQALGNMVFDGLRGIGQYIFTSQTAIEASGVTTLSGFNTTGFSVGDNGHVNTNLDNFIAYQTLYTHIRWGLTSQGKKYVEAYNPATGEGMIMYIGSGLAGHQIPHSAGVEIDYTETKNLSEVYDWNVLTKTQYAYLNLTNAFGESGKNNFTDTYINVDTSNTNNKVNNTYIMYYKTKSKTYTNGTYVGTGVDNLIDLPFNVSRFKVKAVSATGDWLVHDNKRTDDFVIKLNTSDIEANVGATVQFKYKSVLITGASANYNALGVTYYYEGYADTDIDGGGSEEYLPSSTTNLQIADGIISISNGFTANGSSNEIITRAKTITPVGGWL